jgi:hypothetical protein
MRWTEIVILTFVLLLIAVLLHDMVTTMLAHRERDRYLRGHLWTIRRALTQYEYDHGCYPYHPDAQEKALYLLKPYVKDVSVFDSDFAERDINGRARWDDRNKTVVGSDYDYINWPELYRRVEWAYLVVLAEKTGVRSGGKSYLTLDRGHDLYLYAADFPQEIVGGVLFRAELLPANVLGPLASETALQ